MKSKDYYNTISVYIDNDKTAAENLQYNLLGRGYQWKNLLEPDGYRNLDSTPIWVLYINLKTKTLSWSKYLDKNVAYCNLSLSVLGLLGVIKTIIDPPAPPEEYTEIIVDDINDDIRAYVYKDGRVEFYKNRDFEPLVVINKPIIKDIAEALGLLSKHKQICPIVTFRYPSSTSPNTKVRRYIKVTRSDNTYLEGYERDHPLKFKTFRHDKIEGAIEVINFENE